MSLFYNNYQRLRQENDDEVVKLSSENIRVIGGMLEYMKSFQLSMFELEVMRKDLIGIAKEAELEQMKFTDRIGMPEKEFCDNMIQGGVSHSFVEWFILILRDVVLVGFLLYSLDFFIDGCPKDYSITLRLLLETIFFGGIYRLIIVRGVFGRSTYENAGKRKKNYMIYTGIWVAGVVIMIMTGIGEEYRFISGNGWGIWSVLLVLSLAVFFGSNYFWDKQSEKYNWK